MMIRYVVLLSLSMSLNAYAQPLPRPEVDFTAQGRASAAQGPIRLYHRQGILRLEGKLEGQHLASLADLQRDHATIHTTLQGQAMALEIPPMGQGNLGIPRYASVDAQPIGQRRYAGESCTLYRLSGLPGGQKTKGEACLTDDGIPLRISGTTARGKPVYLELTQVRRTQQPAKLFQIPANYPRIPLPPALFGLPTLD